MLEQPAQSPGPGEVRIEVRAAGINPVDWKLYSGSMGTDGELPMRLGFEAAGVASEVGTEALGPAEPSRWAMRLAVRTRSFALEDVPQAHREGQAGHVTGKLVLVPTQV